MKLRKTEMLFIFDELSFLAKTNGCNLAELWDKDTDELADDCIGVMSDFDDGRRVVSEIDNSYAVTLMDRFEEAGVLC